MTEYCRWKKINVEKTKCIYCISGLYMRMVRYHVRYVGDVVLKNIICGKNTRNRDEILTSV